jgi:hypothetical protein
MKALQQCLAFLLLLTAFPCTSVGQSKPETSNPEEVTFQSSKLQLHGFLWKPEGEGPFPSILWNHGSEKLPGSQPVLAASYTAHNYVFLYLTVEVKAALPATIYRIWWLWRLPTNAPDAWSNYKRQKWKMLSPL